MYSQNRDRRGGRRGRNQRRRGNLASLLYRRTALASDSGRRAIPADHRLQRHFRVDRRGNPAVRGRVHRPVDRPADWNRHRRRRAVVPRAGCSSRRPAGAWRSSSPPSAAWRCLRSCCSWRSSAACSPPRAWRSSLASARIRWTTIRSSAGCWPRFRRAIAAGAAWLHWKRFRVPITVAAGAASVSAIVVALVVAALGEQVENAQNLILGFVLLLGVGAFLFAMWWDAPTAHGSRAVRTSPSGSTCSQRR